MKIFALSIFLVVCFWSCRKSSDLNGLPGFPRIDSIKGFYLFNTEQHSAEFYMGAVSEGWGVFQFSGDKIIKRIGGTAGYFGGGTDLIIDTAIYNSSGDTIILKTINRAPVYNIPECAIDFYMFQMHDNPVVFRTCFLQSS